MNHDRQLRTRYSFSRSCICLTEAYSCIFCDVQFSLLYWFHGCFFFRFSNFTIFVGWNLFVVLRKTKLVIYAQMIHIYFYYFLIDNSDYSLKKKKWIAEEGKRCQPCKLLFADSRACKQKKILMPVTVYHCKEYSEHKLP